MPIAELYLIKRCVEHIERKQIDNIPPQTRGIYVLYKYISGSKKFDVVYIGLARGQEAGAASRLKKHNRTKAEWTHFSIFEVWDNITKEQVEELEGLLRHIYRKDTRANKLNIQKSYHKLKKISKKRDFSNW